MKILESILISFSVSADAFAVSLCAGLNNNIQNKKMALLFAIFQSIMPLIGLTIGTLFNEIILAINYWIAFTLLTIIGTNMIYDTINKKEIIITNNKLILLAISTSLDALIIGIAYYCGYGTNKSIRTFLLFGIITYIMCTIGIKIGNKFNKKLGDKSQIIGGIILILLAIKILIEHLK